MATQSDVDPSGILTEQETSPIKEPSEMSPDEKRPVAENEAPQEVVQVSEQDAPLTKEQFSEQMRLLTERARAAGLNPIQTMARTYVKQGWVILEGLLASLENAGSSKKEE